MKRLALLIFLVVFVANVSRRHAPALAGDEPDQATASVQAASAASGDEECPDKVRVEPGSVIVHGTQSSGRVVVQLNGEADDQTPDPAGQVRGHRGALGPKIVVQANPVVPVPHVGNLAAPIPPQPPLPPSLEGIGLPPQLIAELDQAPAWFLIPEDDAQPKPDPRGLRTIKGPPSMTPEKAEREARDLLERKAWEWIKTEIEFQNWTIPSRLLDGMIIDRHVDPFVKTFEGNSYTLYVAGYRADFSPKRKAELIEAHNREMVAHRLTLLGGGLGFALICLGALAGYIRADEATKGYYTNRLRLLAAASVGAAGVAIYQVLT